MRGRVNTTTPDPAHTGAVVTQGARWQQVAGSLVRHTPTTLVISIPSSAEPLRIEGAAAVVWQVLTTPRDFDALVAEVARAGVPTADLADDVLDALSVLAAAGLVVTS